MKKGQQSKVTSADKQESNNAMKITEFMNWQQTIPPSKFKLRPELTLGVTNSLSSPCRLPGKKQVKKVIKTAKW